MGISGRIEKMNFSDDDRPFNKVVRSLVSSLHRTRWWWKANSTPANQTQKVPPSISACGAGMKILTDLRQDPSVHHQGLLVHSWTIKSPSPSLSGVYRSLSQSSTYSSQSVDVVGDLIGTESGVHVGMESNEKPPRFDDQEASRNQQLAMKKEYPPPIPLLTTQAAGSRMPWTLRRYYADGRLILREERVRQCDYFEAHRENGRLILKLVPFDDDSVSEEEDEPQNLDFIDGGGEEESTEEEKEEEMEPYSNAGFEGHDIDDRAYHWEDKKIKATFPSSVPKSCLAHYSERCEDLGKFIFRQNHFRFQSSALQCQCP